jgi:hypothetical protein
MYRARKMQERVTSENPICRVINQEMRKTTKVRSVRVGKRRYRKSLASCCDGGRRGFTIRPNSPFEFSEPRETHRQPDVTKIHQDENHCPDSCIVRPIAPHDQSDRDEMMRQHLIVILSSRFEVEDE